MDPFNVAVLLWMYVDQIIRSQTEIIPELLLNFTEDNNDDYILGTLNITNFTLTGLDTITNERENIEAPEDEIGNNNVCMIYPVEYLQMTSNYVADIGIADEIPIYGDGRILLTMTDIEIKVCGYFSFNDTYVTDVVSSISLHHNPIEFTGIWKNTEASEMLETVLNIAYRFYAMWSTYEPQRAGCLVNPFLRFVLNDFISKENNTITFDNTWECLQGILTDDLIGLDDYEKLREFLLLLMDSEVGANSLRDFLDDGNTKSIISELIRPVLKIIKRVFSNNGT